MTITLGALVLATFVALTAAGLSQWRRLDRPAELTPVVIFSAYSVAAMYTVTVYRGFVAEPAKWYTIWSLPLLLAIVGLVDIVQRHMRTRGARPARFLVIAMTVLAAFIGCGLWLRAQQYRSDFSTNIQARSPVAASCLFHYQSAPPFCEYAVFTWSARDATLLTQLGTPLQAHGLAVFGPNTTRYMQGEWALDQVTIMHQRTPDGAHWLKPGSLQPAPLLLPVHTDSAAVHQYPDYHRLDLALRKGTTIRWYVHIPHHVGSATFRAQLSQLQSTGSGSAPVSLNANTGASSGSHRLTPGNIHFDLSQLAGKTARHLE